MLNEWLVGCCFFQSLMDWHFGLVFLFSGTCLYTALSWVKSHVLKSMLINLALGILAHRN